jgi:hypothetical protein
MKHFTDTKKTLRSLPFAVALLLAACGGGGGGGGGSGGGGGGGGGGGNAALATSYAVSVAQRHLLTDGGTWPMKGTGPDGSAFTLTMNYAPAAPAPFPVTGATAARSIQTLTLEAGGQSDSAATTFYFDTTNLAIAGVEGGGACNVATSNTALPASAKIGDSGAFYGGSDFGGCTGASPVVGSTAIGWSLEDDTGVALLCWNTAAQSVYAGLDAMQSNCVEIDADGKLGTKARFAISALGLTITARNF